MGDTVPVRLVENQDWLEPVAERLQPALAKTLDTGGALGPKIANFLHGTWLGHPLHPVLTDVPIGSWTAALVLDCMEKVTGRRIFGRGADTAITVGLVGAAGAAVTGLADWSKMGGGRARRIGLAHGLINFAGAACYATSLALRKRGRRAAGREFSLLGFAFSAAAAYLGGHLVYGRQIGVDHTAALPLPEEFVSVLPEAGLPENEPRRVRANGTPVLLLRRGERIYALADTCAHLGGPLSEGKLEDGSVVCPWHGSRYSLEDGRVLEGPSAYPQPAFEVRVRDGHIELRAAKR